MSAKPAATSSTSAIAPASEPFPPLRRVDCHMHTPLCGHALGEPVEYVIAAVRNGIQLITFTCHMPMWHDGFRQHGIRMQLMELPRYRDMVAQAREAGRQMGVEVLYGIEAEVSPDPAISEDIRQFVSAEPFDFVLGSLHHMLPAYQQRLDVAGCTTDAQIVERYFADLAAAAASGIYDSLAHPDVIRIYGTLAKRFDPAAHEPAIAAFLDTVAASNTCLEINTSGLIKGDFVVHPDPLIFDWAIARGIPFTIGSDAHSPSMVGQFFGDVIGLFRNRGLDQIHFYRQRQRHALPV